MKNELTEVERRLLRTLVAKPLSLEDILYAMRPFPEEDVKPILFRLNKDSLIVKHPVIGGGCGTCACQVNYLWRLTFAGRQAAAQST
jgi:hypothetical protein